MLTVPKLFVKTIWLRLNTHFPSGSLEFWYMWGKAYLHDQPQLKTMDTESLMNFPNRQHFLCHVTHVLCDFLWISSHVPFPFGDFSWYLFCVLNHSYKYSYMLSPTSPPSKPSNSSMNFLHANLHHLITSDLSHSSLPLTQDLVFPTAWFQFIVLPFL
jgi:hypothetical protein